MSAVSFPLPLEDRRHLGGSGDENGYFTDPETGESYPPYSLSWRYLGMYIDCDANNNNNDRQRSLNEDNNNNSGCQRQLLWAAYHDPGYRGGSIGEYALYNRQEERYSGATCRAQFWWPFTRCRRLNCHEAGTRLQLLGVFKETDGLTDWAEQLFKHQGYCVWGEDANDGESGDSGDNNNNDNDVSDYEFMQDFYGQYTNGCTQLGYTDPRTGNYLYVDTKPLTGGDMTLGLYTDAYCETESSSMTWADYINTYGNNNNEGGGNDNNDGQYASSADQWASSVDRWNDLLSDYKICQPCRSYSLTREVYQQGSHDEGGGSGDQEDGDDGEGGNEQWGFNCYDDAGYRNCNQCYKFQTQTDFELASADDLDKATKQGTILAIKVDGQHYGRGHYTAPGHAMRVFKKSSAILLSTVGLLGCAFLYFKYVWSRRHKQSNGKSDLNEALTVASDEDESATPSSPNPFKRRRRRRRKKDDASDTSSPQKRKVGDSADWSVREASLLQQVEDREKRLSQQEQMIARLQLELAAAKAAASTSRDD